MHPTPLWFPYAWWTLVRTVDLDHARRRLVFALGRLRRGEVAGLHWRNVDLDAGTLTVCAARVSMRYKVVESQPKTDKSAAPSVSTPGS